jgi:hypothetical protein
MGCHEESTVFYGMISVTFFGFVLTPVFYVALRLVTGGLRGGGLAEATGRRTEREVAAVHAPEHVLTSASHVAQARRVTPTTLRGSK